MATAFHGISGKIHGAGYDLTPFLKKVNTSGDRATYDASTLDKVFRIFRGGRVNGEMSAEGLHSTGANEFSAISSAIHGEAKTFMHMPAGIVQGEFFAGIYGSVISRGIETALADMTLAVLNVQAKTGVDLGVILNNGVAVTETGNGASFDTLSAQTQGGAIYVNVTAYTGTAAQLTLKIEDSADGNTWADLAGGTIAAASIVAGYNARIAIPKTQEIRRYVRAAWVDAGGLTSATFTIGLAKYYA
jgi:hypothetical protein